MLQKELSWYKSMFPDLDYITVIDGITQLCQGHMQFIHSENSILYCYIPNKCLL